MDAVPEPAATIAVGEVSCYVPLADPIDLDAERGRLGKELADLDNQIARTEKLPANQNFVQKAKPEVIERERARLEDLTARRRTLRERLKTPGGWNRPARCRGSPIAVGRLFCFPD